MNSSSFANDSPANVNVSSILFLLRKTLQTMNFFLFRRYLTNGVTTSNFHLQAAPPDDEDSSRTTKLGPLTLQRPAKYTKGTLKYPRFA